LRPSVTKTVDASRPSRREPASHGRRHVVPRAGRSDEVAWWDAAADAYDAWVIHPFARGVDFPLRGHIRRLLAGWKRRGELERRVAIDFGCGRGQGLAFFAGRVGFACGLDFSTRMLDLSERALKRRGISASRYPRRGGLVRLRHDLRKFQPGASRTALVEADMRDLSPLRRSADVALAVNSILPARPADVPRVFNQVVSVLKRGGVLMAVLPSLDAFQYLLALAKRRGVRLPDVGRVDEQGMFHEGGERQKFFLPAEIMRLSEASRLQVLALEKVRYPWTLMRRFGWGYFPGRPRLWDWALLARAR
jgi:SAM-dependent methyltransferase